MAALNCSVLVSVGTVRLRAGLPPFLFFRCGLRHKAGKLANVPPRPSGRSSRNAASHSGDIRAVKSSGKSSSSAKGPVLSGKVVKSSSTLPSSGTIASSGAKRLQVTLAGGPRSGSNTLDYQALAGMYELSRPDGGAPAGGGRLWEGYYAATGDGGVGVGGVGYGEGHTVSEALPMAVRKALKTARLAAVGGNGDLGVSAVEGRGRGLDYGDEEDRALGGWQQQREEGVEVKEAGEDGGEEGGMQPRRKRSKKMEPEVENGMTDAAVDALLALNSG